MIVPILLIALGLILLVKGADWFVLGAAELARLMKMSELAVGLTVVAFGTSAPELVVNTFAAAENHYDIVLGNIIGSNNFNLFVILGIAGLIAPLRVQSSTTWKEIPISFIAALLLLLLANDYLFEESEVLMISRWDAAILLGMFAIFLYYVYSQLKSDPEAEEAQKTGMSKLKMAGLIFIGMAGLVIGGRLVVNNAVHLAEQLQVSQEIIGLTIVAAGTSLPELATSVVAAFRKNTDIAVGNIIGSNIFNILFILSLSALVKPIEFNPSFNSEIYFLGAGTALLFIAMFTGKKKQLDRWEAFVLLAAFIGYTILLIIN